MLLILHDPSHTSHLPHNSSHTQLISHNSSHNNSSHTTHLTKLISHTSSHTTHVIRNSSPSSHRHSSHPQLISFISHTAHLTHSSSHTTHLAPLPSQNSSCAAGAVHRGSWRSADSRRRGRGWPLCGRCRAVARIVTAVTAAGSRVAGAVHRASASCRSCGAHSRRRGRGYLLLVAWQAQYTEAPLARILAAVAAATCCVAGAKHRGSPEGAVARIVAAYLLRGRCSTQSLLKELRRG